MLYKNLPDERLSTVMRCRFWLDRLAALQFLLKGERRSFLAVFQARADFRKQKEDFRAARKENLSRMVVNPVPEQARFSILWAYYFQNRHKYSDLPHI